MSTSRYSSSPFAAARAALVAFACLVSLAGVSLPALRAADQSPRVAADNAPSLPLSATFEKGAPGERGGPFVLNLKNTSQDSLKVSGKIVYSVAFHMDTKGRDVPEHEIAAGATWSISDLAAGDKVTLKADGFAPLELEVK